MTVQDLQNKNYFNENSFSIELDDFKGSDELSRHNSSINMDVISITDIIDKLSNKSDTTRQSIK